MHATARTVASLAFGLLAQSAMAAQFWVVNHNDSGPGSLRQALLDMNAAAGDSHQVWFDLTQPNQAIVLQSALPSIAKPVVLITGLKSSQPVVIDGNNAFPLITAYNGSSNRQLSISWLELRNATTNSADAACVVAAVPPGGVVGKLDIRGVTMRNCVANSSQQNATGGAIRADRRDVEIVASHFEGNRVQGLGGVLLQRSLTGRTSLVISGTTFLDNVAEGNVLGRGGALHLSDVDVDITRSRFLGNWSQSDGVDDLSGIGSAIYASGTEGVISDSLFYGNQARRSTVHINSTLGSTEMRLHNLQFVDNEVGVGSNLELGTLRVMARHLTVLGTTTTQFTIPTAIYHFYGSYNANAGMAVHNSVLAPSAATGDSACGYSLDVAALNASSHNIMLADGCGVTANATLADLRIDALRDNGGPVETVSLFAGSAALDHGNPAAPNDADVTACLAKDARGVVRPQPGSVGAVPRCDAGAWEAQGEPPLFRHDFEDVLWRP